MVGGSADSIRIERLDDEKAEFVVVTGQQRVFHQAKMGSSTGKWTLADLASTRHGLIQAIGKALSDRDARFIFASGSHARELDELCAAAGDSACLEELERDFLNEGRQQHFKKLCDEWWECHPSTALERLKRVEVRTIDDRTLEGHLHDATPGRFLAEPSQVVAEILRVVDDGVNQTVTREELASRLAKRGYKLRQLRHPQQARLLIQKATDERYLAHARRRLIRQSLLQRPAADQVLERLTGTGSDTVLTGRAGSGKTACAIQIVESLRERGTPVLVLRLDRLHPHLTTVQLGEHLGLEESPALVIAAAAAAAGGHGVLIIDQLDAISSLSGRTSGAFELVEQLLLEARGLRPSAHIHTVVVCRAFDWENDSGLRQLIPDSAARVDVGQFTTDEVRTVLGKEDHDQSEFDATQLELLRLPQNLSLFLEADSGVREAPAFGTTRELFDQFWDYKRRTVRERAGLDEWLDVVETLCTEMTTYQQLSVRREALDAVSPDYLHQMSSAGVVDLDGNRYGFAHESFFDYCFARLFCTKNEPLLSILAGTEQHLFRRAQVRQVLAYLREADPARYVSELRTVLSEKTVRSHIKDLVLALLADVSSPTPQEWAIWTEWNGPEIEAITEGQPNRDKISSMAWRHFFSSRNWFSVAEECGAVAEWLTAKSDFLADMAVRYLRVHQRHAPDRTAALLEPYADRGGEWPRRLQFFVQRIGPRRSRRLFELFLRLVDNGVLDRVEDESSSEIAFWDGLYGMEKEHPQWVAELLAHKLRRRLLFLAADGKALGHRGLLGYNRVAEGMFQHSAKRAASAFAEFVLPAVLEVSDATSTGDTLPKQDSVWPFYGGYDTSRLDEACLSGLEQALAALTHDETDLTDIVGQLRQRETNTSNRLILVLYAASPERYADEAVSLLCEEPWRLSCSYRGQRYGYAVELVRVAFPHCKEENRRRLENSFLSYVDAFEGTTSGYKMFGWSQLTLLSAIPEELRSSQVDKRLRELARKFDGAPTAPQPPAVAQVRSPIDETSAGRMTDEDWLRAINKHSGRGHVDSSGADFLSGSYELAGVLQGRTKEEPVRFARLALRFPSNTAATYFDGVLRGLQESSVESGLKVSVCQKALEASPGHCSRTVAHVLGDLAGPLSEDAIRIVHYLATEHEDPSEESWQKETPQNGQSWGDGILTYGLNATRGTAAYAIAKMISEDATCIDALRATLDQMVKDRSASVMSCVLRTLRAVARREPKTGLRLFLGATLSDDRVLATQHAFPLIRLALSEDFAKIRPLVERMLQSSEPEVCEAGSTHAGIAALMHPGGEDLANKAISLTSRHRLGLTKVATANIGNRECRNWCEDQLLRFFGDENEEVQREAASCFRHLEGKPLEDYENLIKDFSESAAFKSLPGPLLLALEKSRKRLPGLTYTTCKRFLDTFRGEVARSRRTVTKLVFRTYQQHQADEWGPRFLDLIDDLCLDGVFEVRDALDRFDR